MNDSEYEASFILLLRTFSFFGVTELWRATASSSHRFCCSISAASSTLISGNSAASTSAATPAPPSADMRRFE